MSIKKDITDIIEDCAQQSHAGTIDFGTVIMRLMNAGIESYHADYRRRETTYYLPAGESHVVRLATPDQFIPDTFSAEGVQGAIRASQKREINYIEFMRRSMAAGCVGYVVWIAGRHVQYFGRRGESHIEYFPGSKP